MLKPEHYKYTEIVPFRGKFAVKTKSFFDIVNEMQKQKMDSDWIYKPLRFEFELTNECNIKCEHCGMNAVQKGCGIVHSDSFLHRIVTELSENGIPSISITGGEPFLHLNKLCKLITECAEHGIDVCKITTNGFWGNECSSVFEALDSAGLFRNTLFVPVIMLSIGENTVPFDTIAKIFNFVNSTYSSLEINLCISSVKQKGENSIIEDFIDQYERVYGSFPENRFFLTERVYLNSKYNSNQAITIDNDIDYYIDDCYMCFWPTVGAYVLPTLFMKASGSCYSCAAFNVPDEMYFGNLNHCSLYDILNSANANPYVRIIAKNGLNGFREMLGRGKLKGIKANDHCDACNILISLIKQEIGHSTI